MPTDVVTTITSQTTDELSAIVDQILGEEATPVRDLRATKIGRSVGGGTAGIFRVSGQAQIQAGETTWSAVVKALGTPEVSNPEAQYDPLRELDVYRSGAFADVCGGVRAARCYAIQSREEYHLLWLEDLSGAQQPPWGAPQFIASARHLGQFNAHWPEQMLPQWDWLSRCGIRTDFTANPGFKAIFQRHSVQLGHTWLRRYASLDSGQALMQLWKDCDRLLRLVEGLPNAICHLDCHPKNLFPMLESDEEGYTIGIDWVKVGTASLGIDIGHLLASPITWMELTPDQAGRLLDPSFDAYVSGLIDAGWAGNVDDVRLAYLTRLACESLRNACHLVHAAESPEWATTLERILGFPMAEIVANWTGEALDFYLRCRDEAVQVAKLH